MSAFARLRAGLGRIVPHDVTAILSLDARRLPTDAVRTARATAETLRVLDLPLVRAGARDGVPGFAAALPAALPARPEDGSLHCVAAVRDGALVGHAWFARRHVPAALNTGGAGFAGIGLRLPASSSYVFKVHVAPGHRGRGLGATMIAHGTRHLPGEALENVVTTTDVGNAAFLATAASLGFERRGWAAEYVLGRRHRYRLPSPVAVPGGRRVEFVAGPAVLADGR